VVVVGGVEAGVVEVPVDAAGAAEVLVDVVAGVVEVLVDVVAGVVEVPVVEVVVVVVGAGAVLVVETVVVDVLELGFECLPLLELAPCEDLRFGVAVFPYCTAWPRAGPISCGGMMFAGPGTYSAIAIAAAPPASPSPPTA
jgi:hypothetical protein